MSFEEKPPGLARARFHVILAQPEIAANVGAIGRTCVAAGAMLWLIRPLGFQLDHPQRHRAGLDYWEHLTWRAVDHLDEVASALGHDRLWLFSTKAERSYTQVEYREGDGLVLGPESRGLPESLLTSRPDRAVRIPIRPEARSLNLGNATAIAVFEALRQIDDGSHEPCN
ncbi:tRNA (cytidine(34)-2'-O)-methyltransferase [Singulisphaera rosea]